MSDYDPKRGRQRPTDAAIDAVMGPTGGDAAGPDEPAASDEPVIDLSEPTDSGLSAPTVTPDPPPSDEVLVRLGVIGTIIGALGAGYLWRRLRRRRRSA